jgi:hypothetical protein
MGLDMYAYRTAKPLLAELDFDPPEDAREIAYWRKHPNLHGWMQELYQARGGENPDFNCDTLQLKAEDLDALEKSLGVLPHTEGFFFGESRPEEKAFDVAFIAAARAVIAAGDRVYHIAWW